jgi:5-methylcytosine-specific restriction endonuclease McrA
MQLVDSTRDNIGIRCFVEDTILKRGLLIKTPEDFLKMAERVTDLARKLLGADPDRERLDIMFEQRNQCAICNDLLNPNAFDVDHKVAKSLGGDDERSNLQALCLVCHRHKTHEDNEKARAQRSRT